MELLGTLVRLLSASDRSVNVPDMESTEIDVTGLRYIGGFSVPVYTSPGGEARARAIADRTNRTLAWLGSLVEMPSPPPLFVLDAGNWDNVALLPQYGLAHVNRTRIVIGQEPSGMWTLIRDSVWPDLSDAGRQRLQNVYGSPPDLGRFADLVISHELTHLADRPSWLDLDASGRSWSADEPRLLWFTELFANLGLHGYVVEREPESLPVLEAVFEVIGGTAPARWPFHRLDEMHESVASPDMDGTNYLWYEFRLQILAKRLWESSGPAGFQQIHRMLHGPVLPDEDIFSALAAMDQAVADQISRWWLGDSEPFSSASG